MEPPKPDDQGNLDAIGLLTYIIDCGNVHPIFARAAIANMDKDGNDKVSEKEWKESGIGEVTKEKGDEQLRALFKSLDKDDSGSLSYDDFSKLQPEGVTESNIPNTALYRTIAAQLQKMDKDKDGKVSLEEFLAAAST